MKVIKYNLCTRTNIGTEEAPEWDEVLFAVEMGWNEVNEEISRREAHKGEYLIVDVEGENPETKLTQEERIAELEEALALLLSGVTE